MKLKDKMKKNGRKDPCLCGSGKKYKHCCLKKDTTVYKKPSGEKTVLHKSSYSDENGPKDQKRFYRVFPYLILRTIFCILLSFFFSA